MLTMVLEVSDYEARGAASGAEAFEVMRDWRPDVIAVNILMPGLDGYRFVAECAEQREFAEIPIIVVTPPARSLPPASQLGVRAVLQQPHDVDHLRALIAEAIEDPTGRRNGADHIH